MKRIIAALAVIICMVPVMAQNSTATLSHKGNLTVFDSASSCFADAVKASVDGDTIFLSNGNFTGMGLDNNYITDKKITIVGTGSETKFISELYIMFNYKWDDNGDIVDTELSSDYLIGIKFLKKLYVYNVSRFKIGDSTLSDLHIEGKRTELWNSVITGECDMSISTGFIRGCDISKLVQGQGLEVYNSKIRELTNPSTDSQFINCHIDRSNLEEMNVTPIYAQGCIIKGIPYKWSSDVYENCLFTPKAYDNITSENSTVAVGECFRADTEDIFDENMECTIPHSEFISRGWTCQSGNEVGIYGGDEVYFSDVQTPIIDTKASSIILGEDGKTLKVKVVVEKQD